MAYEKICKLRNVERMEYYELHLAIINPMLPVQLTGMERSVLAALIRVQVERLFGHPLSTPSRKWVMERIGLSKAAFANHLTSLMRKGFITPRVGGQLPEIRDFLLPMENGQSYHFKLQWHGDEAGASAGSAAPEAAAGT